MNHKNSNIYIDQRLLRMEAISYLDDTLQTERASLFTKGMIYPMSFKAQQYDNTIHMTIQSIDFPNKCVE